MKKPLQIDDEPILVWSKGQLIGWGAADVKNLVKKANRTFDEDLKNKGPASIWDEECLSACEWLEDLLEKGASKELLNLLNGIIGNVSYIHVLKYSPNGLPTWRRIANADKIQSHHISTAYGVAHLLAIGALKNLKRCKRESCRRFFLGRPNAKWCSEKCGSHFRVHKKRKRDKQ